MIDDSFDCHCRPIVRRPNRNGSPEYVSTACCGTYMPKLTLSVDEKVVRGAKRYAAARGTSVSRLVERYLDLLSNERGQGLGMVPAHGVTTIFYLLEKARGAAFARDGVERLIRVFSVAPVNDDVVRRALAFAWPDFEDAVCAGAAEASGCDAFVTRDPDGYANAPLPVIDPAAALSWLTQE